jgi:hypothetical protein
MEKGLAKMKDAILKISPHVTKSAWGIIQVLQY